MDTDNILDSVEYLLIDFNEGRRAVVLFLLGQLVLSQVLSKIPTVEREKENMKLLLSKILSAIPEKLNISEIQTLVISSFLQLGFKVPIWFCDYGNVIAGEFYRNFVAMSRMKICNKTM